MHRITFTVFVGILLFLTDEGVSATGTCKPVDRLDVVFAIDNSASISKDNFEELKKFAITLIDNIVEGGTDANIGLIEFSYTAKPLIWLADPENRKDRNEVKQIFIELQQPEEGFSTNTHVAIYIARTQMLNMTYEEGARCNCPKVLIVITDGSPSFPRSTYYEALAARKQGIHVFVVGTGSEDAFPSGSFGSQRLLALFYTGGDESRVFRVADYGKLKKIAKSVVEGTCVAVRTETKVPKIAAMDATGYQKLAEKGEL